MAERRTLLLSVQAEVYGRTIANDIRLFLQQKKIKTVNGWACYQCCDVFQSSSTANVGPGPSNMYINKTTGEFTIPLSGHHGTWSLFQELYHAKTSNNFAKLDNLLLKAQQPSCPSDVLKLWNHCQELSQLSFKDIKSVFSKYCLDKLDLDILSKFDIRYKPDSSELVIPYYAGTYNSPSRRLMGIKVVIDHSYCINDECNPSLHSCSVYPHPSYNGLFGVNELTSSKSTIVLTANEFDTLAINSASSNFCSLSLPFGITNLPLHVLPMLERFAEIILWFGSSLPSMEASEMFAKKLGEKRCNLVRTRSSEATALLALKSGANIDDIISMSVPAVGHNVVSFVDLRSDVKNELSRPSQFAGTPWKRFYNLNKKLKGHRRGELTILTGPTGSGKTTFLSEMSLDLALQGVNTLWGSFEVNNKRLIICMLKQFSKINLELNTHKFDELADDFKKLPITFMTYRGAEDISNVIRTMRQVTYTNDIHHVIIDNLQFMMGTQSMGDRFSYQDHVIGALRKFATSSHVHVTVVVHPRKEDENLPLQISSIFGSAKVTQEADNVLIIQKIKRHEANSIVTDKFLEIAKNRYDGELGRVKLYFNRTTLCMSPPHAIHSKDAANIGQLDVGTNTETSDADFVSQSWINNFHEK